MARDIKTRLIADDEMSPAFLAAGRAATRMALDVEGATLKVEKATKAAAAAEQRFGKESTQAREAAHRLAVANLELAAANDRVTASAEDSSKSVSKGNGALRDVVRTAERGNGALRGMAMTLGRVGATAAATASLVGPLVTGLVGVGRAAAVAAHQVAVAGRATLAAAKAMAPATAALPAFAAGFLLVRGTVMLAAPAIVKAMQPITEAFIGKAGKVGGKSTLLGGLREDVGALATKGLPSLAQGFLRVNFPMIGSAMKGVAMMINSVLVQVGRWVNSVAGQRAIFAILQGTLQVTRQLAEVLPGVVISFGNMIGRAAGPGFKALNGLGPMLDRAADAVKRLFDSTSGEDVGNGFKAIGTTFERVKGAIEGVAGKLAAFGHMVLDVGNWLADNQGTVKKWSDAFAVAGIALGIIATGPVAVLIGSLTLLANHWDAVKGATGQALGAMQEVNRQNRITEQSTSLWSQAVSGLAGWFRDWLGPALQWLGHVVMPMLRQAFNDTKLAIRDLNADSNIWVGALKILGAVLIGVVVAAVVVVVGTVNVLATTFRAVAFVLHNVLVPAFRSMVDFVLGVFGTIVHAAEQAFGWFPGIGSKLHAAANAFDRFRDDVNRSLSGIQDQKVSVSATISYGTGGGTASAGLKAGKMARGGPVTGPGGPRDDRVPAMLSAGEFVVNAAATSRHRGLLEAINGRGYANGGLVMSTSTSGIPQMMAAERKALAAAAKRLAPSLTVGGGAGVQRWAPLVLQVLAMLKQSPSALGPVLSRMQRESGGNPRAINLTDINAKRGDPSIGLMQTIGATFRAYAGPFRGRGIYDPLANIYAGINYATHRYGAGWVHRMTMPGGYDQGGLARGTGWLRKNTPAPERVLSPAQTARFERAMSTGGTTVVEVHMSAPNYVGSRDDLRDTFVQLAKSGHLDVITRRVADQVAARR